jgi:hypothetical protein
MEHEFGSDVKKWSVFILKQAAVPMCFGDGRVPQKASGNHGFLPILG